MTAQGAGIRLQGLERTVLHLADQVDRGSKVIEEMLNLAAKQGAAIDSLRQENQRLRAEVRQMGEEITTRKLVVEQVEVTYSIEVGQEPNPRISIVSEADEGNAGIMGYAKGDEVGFDLTAADPHHRCAGPAAPQVAYGSLSFYDAHDDNHTARISIGDDIKTR